MKLRSAAVSCGLGLAFVLLGASPAAAELTGPCTGSGAFQKLGQTIDPKTTDSATLPPKDSVAYKGTVETDSPAGRSHKGKIELKLPAPLPKVAVADWSADSTDAVSDDGTYEYDLPFIVPRGVKLTLAGEHVDTAGTCKGSMEIEIEGGPLDAPVAVIVALFGTGAFGAGVFVAGKVKP